MRDRAKIFLSGGSQAVRLPKRYRFEGQSEVAISKRGARVILEPIEPSWSERFLGLAGAAPNFPSPPEPPEVEPGPELD